MASRVALNHMGNLPVKTAFAYEGTLTRYTAGFTADGGNEAVAVYSAPIVKGDLVKLYVSEAATGRISVAKATAGDDADYAHGIAVSSPQGIDNATTSGNTPANAYQRRVDVAFFGIAIIELEANGAIPVGSGVELSESESNVVGDDGTNGENGGWVAMSLGADGVKIAILVGASHYHPAD